MPSDFPPRRGVMLVLSSPSGAGKTSIARQLLDNVNDGSLVMSVSATTRPQREGEKDGVDYYFISKAQFSEMLNRDDFLEHAEVFDHLYGTPASKIEEMLSAGFDVVFDIDWQGTQQLSETGRDDMVTIFILPPDAQSLENRICGRGRDSMEVIERRMRGASEEISHYAEYDYVIINDVLAESVDAVERILFAERAKRSRQNLTTLVSDMRKQLEKAQKNRARDLQE